MATPALARRLWHQIELVHAVTYFAAECREANIGAGLRGFWMGYFATRAAPMGPVRPAVVEATFYNFAPSMVAKAIPDAWAFAEPERLLDIRAQAAGSVLRSIAPSAEEVAAAVYEPMSRIIEAAPRSGRPLFAANASVQPSGDPVADLWQQCTAIREHRGDGHVAALVHAAIDGIDAHLLQIGAGRAQAEAIQPARGWTKEDWSTSHQRLAKAGVLDQVGMLTRAGRLLHDDIESTTDRLAAVPLDAIGEDATIGLLAKLEPFAAEIRQASVVPFPNPMGLPSGPT